MPSILEVGGGWVGLGEGMESLNREREEGPRLKKNLKIKTLERHHLYTEDTVTVTGWPRMDAGCVGGAQCTVRESSHSGPNSKRAGEYLAVTFPGGVHRRAHVKYSLIGRHTIELLLRDHSDRPRRTHPRERRSQLASCRR